MNLLPAPPDLRFVLLMRHAKHGPDKDDNPQRKRHEINGKGETETEAVTDRLKEYLDESRDDVRLGLVLHASSPEAAQTALRVVKGLAQPELKSLPMEELTPKPAFALECYRKNDGDPTHPAALGRCLAIQIYQLTEEFFQTSNPERVQNNLRSYNAILIVGHQPLLDWIAHAMSGCSPPLAHSEMVCLDVDEEPQGPRWVMSPSNREAVTALREKIQSKMNVAKELSAFLGGGLSFLLATMADKDAHDIVLAAWPLFAAGCLCLLGALGLFIVTMCSYDKLLMPAGFWSETPAGSGSRPRWLVARPPSGEQWILYQNMVRIWQWQFLPAAVLLMAGLLAMAVAVFGGQLWPEPFKTLSWWAALGVPALAAAVGVSMYYQVLADALKGMENCPGPAGKFRYVFGPWLGSED